MIKELLCEKIISNNKPSLYADPLAWGVVNFIENSFSKTQINFDSENTAIIVVSDTCSKETIEKLYPLYKKGRSSPLKFAGANPGVLAGLASIIFKFRGPSIVLAMMQQHSGNALYALTKYWFTHEQASQVFVITHEYKSFNNYFKGTLLTSGSKDFHNEINNLIEN